MSSMLDALERYFTGSRDRMLARSKHDYSQPVYILGWRVVIPTKPSELFSGYFIWPSVFTLPCLFLPSIAFIIRRYPAHSRYEYLAAAAHLAGNDLMTKLYTGMDVFARATPYFTIVLNTLIQLLFVYNLLRMFFWNRRARRVRANPPPEPPSQPALSPTVWPPPPRME